MKGTVHYEQQGEVALLSIDNPPVNPLSSGVRQGLFDGVNKARDDDSVKAIVITGMHRGFIAGADISEFGAAANEGAQLHEVLDLMESSEKPIIAAINGTAFGGGLETALCCDYRIALNTAPVGLPEVKLGILPGAGGTQRLPRLIGAAEAIKVMVTGNPILAPKALKLGIVDKVVDDNIVEAGIAFANDIIADGAKTRKIRDLTDKIDSDKQHPEIFTEARVAVNQRQRGQFAPAKIIDCVEAAVNAESFDEGKQAEMDLFMECFSHPQRAAMIYVFFSERAANKIADVPKDTPTVDIQSASVIGAGTMGGGIAMCFANVGIPVKLNDNTEENLQRGIDVIEKNYARSVKRGRLTQEKMDHCLSLIQPTLNFEDLGDSDIVIEAVYENLDLKKDVFTKLDAVMKEGALLATNTSALDVDAIANVTNHPEMVLGLHFFSPANVMRLLEVVRGEKTSPTALATAMQLAKRLKKVAVVAGNAPGFIGNAMIHGYGQQAQQLLLEGAKPHQIDKALYDFGLAMGPIAMADMVGLDLGWRARKMAGGNHHETTKISDALCELGRYGQKNAKGFYHYDKGSRVPNPDPEADEVIDQVAKELGYEQKTFSDEDIQKRCIYPLINIGASLLEQGIAQRAGDIDTVYINGYGFPAYLGGPMYYANQVGLKNIVADLEKFQQETGDDFWQPATLLVNLAEQNASFS